jgi:hypothetical protein
METTPQQPDEPTPDDALGNPETPAGDPEDPAGGPPPTPDDAEGAIGDAEHDEESAGEDPAT